MNVCLRWSVVELVISSFLTFSLPPAAAEAGKGEGSSAERALCPVCRVHEGETEEEAVRASAVHEGTTYHFCSEGCRDRFLEAPRAYLPPVFPRPVPPFVVDGLEGGELSSEDLPGRVSLLDFWATWCLPCVTDLPRLSSLHQRYSDRGFQVVGISIDEGDKAARKVARMVRKKGVTHPIYLDRPEASAWGGFLVRAIPAQFLLDREGRIVAQWSGVIDLATVEAAIQDLLPDSVEADP